MPLFRGKLTPPASILLVEPPFYRIFGYERWHYPATLTILGSYLEAKGYRVRILDADRPSSLCRSLTRGEARDNYQLYKDAVQREDQEIWQEVLEAIERDRPDAVAFTSITPKIASADIIARKIKREYGDAIRIFLGGPHVDGMRAHFPDYDFGAQYDAVLTRDDRLKQEIFNRKPNKSLIIGHERYPAVNFASVLTSIGCPNRCTFCCHSFDRVFSYRDADNLHAEFREIAAGPGGRATVNVMDDCLFSNSSHFNKVTDLVRLSGLQLTCGSRVMALSEQKIARFSECGGTKLYIGIESGSQRVLDRIEKNLPVPEIRRRTRWLNDAGIPWSAFFVVGFPFETLDDLKATEELIYEISPGFASINRFTPYPGTKLFQEYFSKSRIDFMESFQLNPGSLCRLPDREEAYIDAMFDSFDAYNSSRSTLAA